MLYFLGIVAEEDFVKGRTDPSYILRQSAGESENRSGYRVTREDLDICIAMPKVLVSDPANHPELVDFLSGYRTRDHMHGDKAYSHDETKKYYPKGALMWFPCDIHGDRLKKPPIFIKRLPDPKVRINQDQGKNRLEKANEERKRLPYLMSKEDVLPLGYDCHKYTIEKRRSDKWSTRHSRNSAPST